MGFVKFWTLQVTGPLPKRGGDKLEYAEKTPDLFQKLSVTYIILEMKNPSAVTGINPSPPLTLVITLLDLNITFPCPTFLGAHDVLL